MVNTQIDQRTSHKVRETRSLENLKLLTICLLTASIVVCYQDVYTATFRKHRFRSLVRTQRLKCETGSQLLGPFRTAVSHFRRFAFRILGVSPSHFRDTPVSSAGEPEHEVRCQNAERYNKGLLPHSPPRSDFCHSPRRPPVDCGGGSSRHLFIGFFLQLIHLKRYFLKVI